MLRVSVELPRRSSASAQSSFLFKFIKESNEHPDSSKCVEFHIFLIMQKNLKKGFEQTSHANINQIKHFFNLYHLIFILCLLNFDDIIWLSGVPRQKMDG